MSLGSLKMILQFYGKQIYAPDCVLNMLKNTQLAESLRVWYRYRDLIKENLGYGDYHLQDLIWWNRKVRLKTKKYFYQNWFDQGIYTVDDLYRGRNFVKTFEDLVIEFDISIKDRRKYSYLMNVFLWTGFITQRMLRRIFLIR